ncbi:MAG TPA: prepilin-type N-terminal cleavage/methylation domain-containing protein [Phycisphaerae bacterium]|nr:prepilin-type N-terminal cleavage/methylation domain-containing protein [Phycisphaerae bacterium]
MSGSKRRAPYGFTLVELLTVIFIIALLISILVPALNAVRNQARNAKTSGELSSIEKGVELFHGELGKYPHSHGRNPFFDDAAVILTGAQWLAVQLVGPDMQGYVKPELAIDTNDNGEIDEADWEAWYELDPARAYPRLGPYVPTEGDIVKTFMSWREEYAQGVMDDNSDLLKESGSRWGNDRVPFFVDAYGLPIVYYAASTYAKKPFVTGTADLEYGRYDQSDNAGFTGTEGGNGRNPRPQGGLDPYGDAEEVASGIWHPLGIFGYDPSRPNDEPDPLESFAGVIMDQNIFEANRDAGTGEGRVWPHNADSFILVSPGKDGLWGTKDDVSNIQRGD